MRLKFFFIITLSFFISTNAFAFSILKGREARDYVGDAKAKLTSSIYSFNILARSHRDLMHGRFSDGVLFNPGGGKMRFIVRREGECSVVFNDPNGREVEPVNEDLWRTKIKNTIEDDNRDPIVILDDQKRELAIVFVGSDTRVEAKVGDDNLLRIDLKVQGAQGGRSMRRHGY